MQSDPIVAEIRGFRELHASRFDFDIRRIVRDVQKRDAAGDRKVVRLPPHGPVGPAREAAKAETSGG